jgi:hypothetical protein
MYKNYNSMAEVFSLKHGGMSTAEMKAVIFVITLILFVVSESKAEALCWTGGVGENAVVKHDGQFSE